MRSIATNAESAAHRNLLGRACWVRHPLSLALQIALISTGASAADIKAQLAPGDGFEINSQSNVVRLRVNDDGSVLIPALPGSSGEEQFLCFDTASGLLGRCATIPTGATGATGPIGPIGPIGATGATGVAGTNGATGATGSIGSIGLTGATGITGANGATGTAGSNGVTGAAGATGATGPIGPIGATGATGVAGTNGATGSTGATGSIGPIGPTGATGIAGANGATGGAGAAGATGATGAGIVLSGVAVNANGTVAVTDSAGTQTSSAATFRVGGNAATATIGLGTTSNNHIDLVSNNVVRGRLSNQGELFFGATAPVSPGDLVASVGNASFPWAVNGYSAFDGGGVYGTVTGGTSVFAGVQGEYNGTSPRGSGVRGLYLSATPGTSFIAPAAGVFGDVATIAGAYKFGVYGNGGLTTRSGAVLGNDTDVALGALGYFSFSNQDYSVYGFGQAYQVGIGTGRADKTIVNVNTNIALGMAGGVMGGWIRGEAYGLHVKGERSSLYVDGTSFNTQPTIQLIDTGGAQRAVTYAVSSESPDVYARGRSTLSNGRAFVQVDETFRAAISRQRSLREQAADVVITVTPMGESKGIYVAQVSDDGFEIRENGGNSSNVAFSWMAIARRADVTGNLPAEVLASDFDGKMRGVMANELQPGRSQPIWWDGSTIHFDTPPPNPARMQPTASAARPQR